MAAKQAEQQKKAKEEQQKKEAAAAQQHAEIKAALGITDNEAKGFEAMVSMLGVSSISSAVAKFKQMEADAKAKGYSELSGFENALIKLYTGPGSGAINEALRYGAMTEGQFVYRKFLNTSFAPSAWIDVQAAHGRGGVGHSSGLHAAIHGAPSMRKGNGISAQISTCSCTNVGAVKA